MVEKKLINLYQIEVDKLPYDVKKSYDNFDNINFVSKIKERDINYWEDNEIDEIGKVSTLVSNEFNL